MPGSLVYVPTLIEDKLALDEKAVGIKHWKDLRKARERKAKAMPNPEQVRRSMHQDCLLNPRNFVFYPFFTHFSPFFAHFQRLDARNPENTTRSPGENGKKSIKIVENGGN